MIIINSIFRRRELSRLQKSRKKVFADYDAELRKLQAEGKSEEEAHSQANAMFKGDMRVCYTNVNVFLSDQLIAEAERLNVLVPQGDRYWAHFKYSPKVCLSEEGQETLHLKIRDEHKEQRETISFWFNIITVILSLVVAILAILR